MTRTNGIRWWLTATMIAALAATAGAAEDRLHTVKAGESASAIAKRYYGAYELAGLLLLYNGRTDSVLRIDETLRIPNAETHRVQRGDSWSGIAKRYLGRVSAYPALASLNGRSAQEPLHPGDELLIPVVAVRQLSRGETLGSLAELFYDDPSLAGALASFNSIEDPRRLSVGQRIEIPIMKLRAIDRDLPTEGPAPVLPIDPASDTKHAASRELERQHGSLESQPDETTVPRFAEDLRTASTAYAAGDYAASRKLLETIRPEVDTHGTTAEQRRLHRLLTFVYVAFELPDETCASYRSLSEQSGAEVTWDPDLVSPKIREWASRCN